MGQPERKMSFGTPRPRWVGTNKLDLKEKSVGCMYLVQSRVQLGVLVNT
jgi:hypothetical protein